MERSRQGNRDKRRLLGLGQFISRTKDTVEYVLVLVRVQTGRKKMVSAMIKPIAKSGGR